MLSSPFRCPPNAVTIPATIGTVEVTREGLEKGSVGSGKVFPQARLNGTDKGRIL
jgi:hypothetical protein